MSKVLGEDSGSWLLLLGDLVAVTLGIGSVAEVLTAGSRVDRDLSAAKLSVVKEESGLSCGLLLEGDCGGLGALGWGDLDAGDLSTARLLAMSSTSAVTHA